MSSDGKALTWWETETWQDYEAHCGEERGARHALLQSAEFTTRVVDLAQSKKELWAGVRRSYHSLINGLDQTYPDNGADKGRIVVTKEVAGMIALPCAVHGEVVGKLTRSYESWEDMDNWLRSGNALMVMVFEDNGLSSVSGYVYFTMWDGWAYYHSAACKNRDANIGLVWWAMLALKHHGIRWCELGWQGEDTTKKGKGIEFFRRGFGGRDVPVACSGRALTQEEWDGALQAEASETAGKVRDVHTEPAREREVEQESAGSTEGADGAGGTS